MLLFLIILCARRGELCVSCICLFKNICVHSRAKIERGKEGVNNEKIEIFFILLRTRLQRRAQKIASTTLSLTLDNQLIGFLQST